METLQVAKNKIDEKRGNNSILWRPLIMAKDVGSIILNKIDSKRYHVMIIKEHKAICFYIARVASSSLKIVFKGKEKLIAKNNLQKFDNYFKFTFVRNPYSRLVTSYKDMILFKQSLTHINGMSRNLWKFGDKFWPNMGFKDFANSVSQIPDKKADGHFRSQYCFITDKHNRLVPDFIGKIENLEEDYKEICKKIGIKNPLKFPHANKSINKSYKSYYDEETKKIIQKRYFKDFKMFKYSF